MTSTSDFLLRALERFQSLCDLEELTREAALEQLRAEDPKLCHEVESLLERDTSDAADTNIGLDREGLARLVIDPLPVGGTAPLPQRIGPYRVISRLGAGGMGVVYEAEQDSPRRRVAVKVVHPAALSQQRLKRLRREAEILGRLEHPGIAQIYEAGFDDFGAGPQPFFAMEFVDGMQLSEYANHQRLSQRQRLHLFTSICDAVAHAHSQGILHRDLKPDNVLVLNDGRIKVLDFGVARMDAGEGQLTSLQTDEGRLVGTLAYMSPEQSRGQSGELGPETDVYALGALLFELLSGFLPHDVSGQDLLGALQVIQRNSPARLGSIDTQLRGDLELICAKALELDPDRRYPGAKELGEDVRRHLNDMPILARRATAVYELKKFVRRNPALVAGMLSTAAVLVLGVIASSILALRAVRGERLAQDEAYSANLQAARSDARAGDPRAARQSLAEVPQSRRGWEWHHLDVALRGRAQVLRSDLQLGSRIAVVHATGLMALSTERGLEWLDRSGQVQRTSPIPSGLRAMTPRPGREGLALGFESGLILTLDPAPNGEAQELTRLDSAIEDLRWNPTGEHLVAAAGGQAWTVEDGGARAFYQADESWSIESVDRVAGLALVGLKGGTKVYGKGVEVVEIASGMSLWGPGNRYFGRSPRFAPDASVLVEGSRWGNIEIMDARTGKKLRRVGGHSGQVRSLAFSPDGRCFASFAEEGLFIVHRTDGSGTVAALDVTAHIDLDGPSQSQKQSDSLDAPEPVRTPSRRVQLAWLDDSTLVASIGPHLLLWNLEDQARLEVDGYAYAAGFSPSGRWLLVSNHQGVRTLWDTALGTNVGTFKARGEGCAFTPDGLHAVSYGSGISSFSLTDLRSTDRTGRLPGKPERWQKISELLSREAPITVDVQFALAPHGEYAAVLGKICEIVDPRTGVQRLEFPPGNLSSHGTVAISPDGRRLAWAGNDLWICDPRTGAVLEVLTNHGCAVYSAAYSPDGTRLATGSVDGTVLIWDTRTYEPIVSFRDHSLYVRGLCWSPDGTRLISASGDGTVLLRDSVPPADRQAERDRAEERLAAIRPRVARWLEDPKTSLLEQLSQLDPEERDDAIAAAQRLTGLVTE